MATVAARAMRLCSDPVGFYSLSIDMVVGSMLSITHVYITYEEMRAAAINTLNPQRTAMIVADFLKVDNQYWRIIALYMYLNMMVMCRYQIHMTKALGPSSFLLLRLRNSWILSTIKLQRERNRVEPAKKISLIKCLV
nr:protein root UVB sensitive 2, chloroplastic-like [Tanacetum cinerariifolium]